MRAARSVALFVALALEICLPGLIRGQANWTPNLQHEQELQKAKESALWGISVGLVTLNPKDAREQYNIEISAERQFVTVQQIESESWAARGSESLERTPKNGIPPSEISVGDLVDTVVLGGEIPKHGEVKSLDDWNRFVARCKPSCLLLVRHKGQSLSNLNSLGLRLGAASPADPRLFFGAIPSLSGPTVWGICDKLTKYLYIPYLPSAAMPVHDNWLSPQEFAKAFGTSYEGFPAPTCDINRYDLRRKAAVSHPASSNPQHPNSVQQEIDQIRNAPHEAMPPAQAAGAALGGQTSMTVENGTPYSLYVYLSGPASQQLEIAAGQSQTVSLSPGHYEVAAKVSNPSVIPFYGTEDYAANTGYSSHFYVATQRP